ncbi:hypothetical protein EYZ11_012803 [Aspergillus tanneri]|uniref:Uncharacterized protein n=1 Tax=Aspergillus tanneri TaxID=1220188 RepID=A0A4V3UML4_9EURO|nr:hypothetical protein EYZ11_012803 [Aspergillus tanneri]
MVYAVLLVAIVHAATLAKRVRSIRAAVNMDSVVPQRISVEVVK